MALDIDGKMVNSREQFEDKESTELRDVLKSKMHGKENKAFAKSILLERWDFPTIGYLICNGVLTYIKGMPCRSGKHDFDVLDVKVSTEIWHKTYGGEKIEGSNHERTVIRRLTKCKNCDKISGNQKYTDETCTTKVDPDLLVVKYGLGWDGVCSEKIIRAIIKGETK